MFFYISKINTRNFASSNLSDKRSKKMDRVLPKKDKLDLTKTANIQNEKKFDSIFSIFFEWVLELVERLIDFFSGFK